MPIEELAPCGGGGHLPMIPRPYCRNCAKPLADKYGEWGQCWWCTTRLKEINTLGAEPQTRPYAFERAGAAGLYISDKDDKGEVGSLVLQMKQSDEPVHSLAIFVAHALKRRYADFKPQVLVPMPSAASKSRHPAVGLAKAVGAGLGVPVRVALELDESYESKKGATEQEKFDSCRDRFRVVDVAGVAGVRVLLVDDVLTTVGHAHWAATELLRVGAASVHVIAAARTVTSGHLAYINYAGRA